MQIFRSYFLPLFIAFSLLLQQNLQAAAYAYVSLDINKLAAYKINNDGTLSFIESISSEGADPRAITIHPKGKFLYVVNLGGNSFASFKIDSLTGRLKQLQVIPFTSPDITKVHPSGKFLYSLNFNRISGYRINQKTGILTHFTDFTEPGLLSLAISPDGKFAYAGTLNNTIITLAITCDGTLEKVGSPIQTGGNRPISIAVDPCNRFVYISNEFSGNISGFRIDSNGSLHHIEGSPFGDLGIPTTVIVDATGEFVLSSNENPQVASFEIGPKGALQLVSEPELINGIDVALDPSNRFAYVPNGSGGISIFNFNSITGTLSFKQNFIPAPSLEPNNIATVSFAEVESVSPHYGPRKGHTLVTIRGNSFTEATQVRFGLIPAKKFTVINDDTIEAISPRHCPRTVHITVETPTGTSKKTDQDKFKFIGKKNE